MGEHNYSAHVTINRTGTASPAAELSFSARLPHFFSRQKPPSCPYPPPYPIKWRTGRGEGIITAAQVGCSLAPASRYFPALSRTSASRLGAAVHRAPASQLPRARTREQVGERSCGSCRLCKEADPPGPVSDGPCASADGWLSFPLIILGW